MKRLFILAAFATAIALPQTAPTGTVDISTAITATAGTLQCVGTPTVGATTSTMHMKCSEAGVVLHEADYAVTAPGSTLYSLGRGSNTVTWLLSKGNPVPDQWQVAANGVSKSGSF
jgi:hypothetical protein